MMKRIYTMMAALLAGFATLSAQEAQEIPGTLDVNKAVLDTKTSGKDGHWDDAISDMNNGGTATFTLKNATKQAYKITFDAFTKNSGVTLNFNIKNGEEVVFDKTVDINNTGGWGGNGWSAAEVNQHKCFTPELPVSDNLTLVITFIKSGSKSTANIRNIEFAVKANGEGDEPEQPQEEIVNQIPTDDNHPFVLTGAEVTGTGTVKADDNGAFDSFRTGATATVQVNCVEAGFYRIAFTAASKNGATLNFAFYKEGETEAELVKDVVVEGKGDWSNFDVTSDLGQLSTGRKSLVITFTAVEGQSWTANVKDVKIAFNVEKEVIVNQIPTDDTHPFVLTGAEITGSGEIKKDVENGAFDSFKNGATATINVDCTQAGNYKVAFTAASKNGATLNFAFFKEGETEAELSKDVVVAAAGSWEAYDMDETLGQLSVGKKTLVITFTAAEGQTWTSNMKNVAFTMASDTGISTTAAKTAAKNAAEGQMYLLDGRKTDGSHNGIVIVNGKKVVR